MILDNNLYCYLKTADDRVKFQEKIYIPLYFTLKRARSEPIHYVYNYISDGENVFYVDHFKTKNLPTLKLLKNIKPSEFVPIHWYIAKSEKFVFHNDKRVRGVKNVEKFDRLNDEMSLYFDGELYYDRFVKPLPFDYSTFQLVPYTSETREKYWKKYNDYLISRGLKALPIECAGLYSEYMLDQNGLYRRYAQAGDDIVKLSSDQIQKLFDLQSEEKNPDLIAFIEEHPEFKKFEWFQDSLIAWN